jgi:flagellar hook-associated protein 3 FlgL
MKAKDIEGSPANEGEIRVTYEKDDWLKGDLRPEHYFACKTFDADNTADASVSYNEDYLDNTAKRQSIEYDIGFNQTIQVNSTADECFNHGIGREVDDIMRAMQDVLKLEAVKTDIESALSNVDENDAQAKKILQNQLEAVEKGLTLAKEKEQRLFEKGITSFQKHLDAANLSLTSCGARSSKLELVKNRTQNQKTTFETLKSENEDIDITEVIVGLTAAELTYNASLMATGKVAQTTLLNYI